MTRRGLIRKIELQEIKKKIRFYIIQTKKTIRNMTRRGLMVLFFNNR
jgi:hypothetical protein